MVVKNSPKPGADVVSCKALVELHSKRGSGAILSCKTQKLTLALSVKHITLLLRLVV